jgi:hypothetical protein
MVMVTTRWGPDTCSCEFDLEWDDEVAEINRTIHLKSVVTRDAIHAALTDATEHYNAVLEENKRKNNTIFFANGRDDRLNGENMNWSFTPERVLEVTIVGVAVSRTRKNNIEADCALSFGPGRVRIL